MIKLLIISLACLVLSGCASSRYSERTEANFHEAKVRLSQLRAGMTRAEVEAVLKAIPQKPVSDWDNTGYLPVSYLLYPGISVTIDYLAPKNVLLQRPAYLDVALNRRDKPTRDFTRIPLNQIP